MAAPCGGGWPASALSEPLGCATIEELREELARRLRTHQTNAAPLDLDAIEGRWQRTTPTPEGHPREDEYVVWCTVSGRYTASGTVHDARALALGREDVPALVAEVRRLRALPAVDALLAELEVVAAVEHRTLRRASDVTEIVVDLLHDAEDAFLNKAPNGARASLLRAAAWALLAVRRIDDEAGEGGAR